MDTKTRKLERQAEQGDPQALEALRAAMQRTVEPKALAGDMASIDAMMAFTKKFRLGARQPEWVYLDNLGDVNFLDYGGFLVFLDKTWSYDPEVEVVEVNEDREEDEEGFIEVYRFTLEPHTYENGILSDNAFHPEHPAWYAEGIEQVAASISSDVEDMIADLVSPETILERARVYQDLIGYHGLINFDSYPLAMTKEEAEERYKEVEEVERKRRRSGGRG